MKLSISKGFTLIELIAGIMLISVAMLFFTNTLQNSNRFVADPWHQVRASELGSALMNEILAKSFDENANRTGGLIRCGSSDPGAPNCSAVNAMQPDNNESNRGEYDDVDDYHNFSAAGDSIVSLNIASNPELKAGYANFSASVKVFYDANFDGTADTTPGPFKLIQITVIDPLGNQIQFASYKGNY